MIYRNTIVVALLSTFCAMPVWSQDQSRSDDCDTHETPKYKRWLPSVVVGPATSPVKELKVTQVIFVGNPAMTLPGQELVAKALTEHDYNVAGGLDELLERTRDAWQSQGYFKTEVELSGVETLEENSGRRTVAITVKVDAGKQYRLEEIEFNDGASSSPGQARATSEQFSTELLRAFFPIKPGEIFDTHKLQAGTEELRKAYGKKGFINFAAVPTFNIDETNDRITLVVDLDEGMQFRVGKVQVLGGDPLHAQELIKNSGLTPGAVFDASRLDELKLSKNFRPGDDVERVLDEKQGTVDLTITLPDCP
jgi:outer membrane protein insertion porin family